MNSPATSEPSTPTTSHTQAGPSNPTTPTSRALNNFLIGFIKENSTSGLVHGVPLETPLHPPKRRRFFTPPSPLTPEPTPTTPSTSRAHTKLQVIVGSSTPKTVSRYQRPLRDTDKDLLQAYGSETDSDVEEDDFEDEIIPMSVPRAQRYILLNDEEKAPEAQAPEAEPLASASSVSPSPSPSLSSPAASATVGPTDLFSFEWRKFPNPPIPPNERREMFSDINCGPTVRYLTPYDAFIAIWNREIMEYIVVETNRYAQQVASRMHRECSLKPNSRIKHWRETNVDELYVYFALLVASSMCYKSNMTEYWNKKGVLATPYFGYYMSVNRFRLLSNCLHFNNNTTDLLTMTRPEAKIFKIAPVVEHLNRQFQSLYNLNRNISLDESLTMWKGLLNIKQYIKNKAASTGIKTYEICEAQTGYMWRFKVYAGPEASDQSAGGETPTGVSGGGGGGGGGGGATGRLVRELVRGLERRGHTVWMDNYYNSPALARVLKSLGFDCVGTLRTDRQCVPPQLANLKTTDMVVGQISGCTSGDVDVMVWRDKNRVGIISTYHGAGVNADGEGKWKPIAIRDYNLCMGGVDKKDQMLSAYPLERKRSRVWYKKLFHRLLNASVLNAHILYKNSSFLDTQKRVCTHRAFRKTLVSEILERHFRCYVSSQKISSEPTFTPAMFQHFPVEYGLPPPGDIVDNRRIRRSCVVCRKRIHFYCEACSVPLCIFPCHKTFHEKKYVQGLFS